jgi:hypothetical protein
MISKKVFPYSLILSAVLTLSACGGTGVSGAAYLEAAATNFSTNMSSLISALTTSAGLNSKTLTDLFNTKYLDGGFTKADLVTSLTDNATALGTTPELSLFPLAAISNTKLTGCDSNDICTLTGTLTNSDADTTSIDFSTKVIDDSGVVYLYGDQSSTSSI